MKATSAISLSTSAKKIGWRQSRKMDKVEECWNVLKYTWFVLFPPLIFMTLCCNYRINVSLLSAMTAGLDSTEYNWINISKKHQETIKSFESAEWAMEHKHSIVTECNYLSPALLRTYTQHAEVLCLFACFFKGCLK